jgi:iron complex outermembrane receptor protein
VTYINEVPITTHGSSALYDLENVQVLKGPQGTLFGRNTTGGAILYKTASPGEKMEGYITGRYGNYDSKHLEGAITIPLGDKLGVRIAGSYTGGGAFQHDLLNDRWLGAQDIKSVRGTISFKPSDTFTNVTVIQHNDEGGSNTSTLPFSYYACNQQYRGADGVTRNIGLPGVAVDCAWNRNNPVFAGYLAAHPLLPQMGIGEFTLLQRNLGPWTTYENRPLAHSAFSTFVTNTSTFEVNDDFTIKNIFGYNRNKADDDFDYDGTPFYEFEAVGLPTANGKDRTNIQGYITDTTQFSDELQAQGKAMGGKLNYVVGLYYSYQRDIHESNLAYSLTPYTGSDAPTSFAYNAKNVDKSKAAFAQITYKATDKLSLTGGFRYTWENLALDELPKSVYYAFVGAAPERSKSSSPSWLVSLDYQITDTLLAYVTHRGSWRTGGFNWNVFPTPTSGNVGGNVFLPEKTKDIEIGMKYSGDELGVPVRLEVALYNQWVDNIQRADYFVNPLNATVNLFSINVPQAQTTGAEVGGSFKPTSWLTIGASGAFTNARFTKPTTTVAVGGTPIVSTFGPMADAPRWTGSIYFDITHELDGNLGTLVWHYEIYGQTGQWFSQKANTTTPFTQIAPYSLTNTRVTWGDIAGSQVALSFYARNLFNHRYYSGGNGSGEGSGLSSVVAGMPRMFGGELKWKF